MKARPVGSTARYCPGKPRITPIFPKVSWLIFSNAFVSPLNRSTTMRPLSEPMRMKSVSFPTRYGSGLDCTGETEGLERPDKTVYLVAADHVDVSAFVQSPQLDDVSSRNNELLRLRRAEVAYVHHISTNGANHRSSVAPPMVCES